MREGGREGEREGGMGERERGGEKERERQQPELSFSSCDTSLEVNDFYSNLNNNVKLSFQMFSLARNKNSY